MKFICDASSSDEYLENYDYIYIDITPADAKRYLKYRKAYKLAAREVEQTLYCLEIFDYSTEAFHYCDEIDDIIAANHKTDFDDKIYDVPQDFVVPGDAIERTECNMVKVMDRGMVFTMFPKFTDIEVCSPTFTWEFIEQLAKEKVKTNA